MLVILCSFQHITEFKTSCPHLSSFAQVCAMHVHFQPRHHHWIPERHRAGGRRCLRSHVSSSTALRRVTQGVNSTAQSTAGSLCENRERTKKGGRPQSSFPSHPPYSFLTLHLKIRKLKITTEYEIRRETCLRRGEKKNWQTLGVTKEYSQTTHTCI